MSEISEEVRRAYKAARDADGWGYRYSAVILADFARDTLARAMKAEHEIEHQRKSRKLDEGENIVECGHCAGKNWQQSADHALRGAKGAGMSISDERVGEIWREAFLAVKDSETSAGKIWANRCLGSLVKLIEERADKYWFKDGGAASAETMFSFLPKACADYGIPYAEYLAAKRRVNDESHNA